MNSALPGLRGGVLMARVGRPSLPYKTRHVMVNMKDEHYEYMKQADINMSNLINEYLDSRFTLKICPTCFSDDIDLSKTGWLLMPAGASIWEYAPYMYAGRILRVV